MELTVAKEDHIEPPAEADFKQNHIFKGRKIFINKVQYLKIKTHKAKS